MNVIQKSVDDIKRRIPKEILNEAFLPYNAYGVVYQNVSLDSQIINTVIKARVLPDCDIIGGVEVLVPLSGLQTDTINNNSIAIHIPKERTQGRSIIIATSIVFINVAATNSVYGFNGAGANSACSSGLLNTANSLLKSYDSIPNVSSSRVQLIAENTVLIKEMAVIPGNSFLRCILANDEEMTNIPIRAYRYISKLVELAVKSYVYNELIIKIDMGQLRGGANLGIFKDIVQGFSDSEQMYQDYLNDVMQQVLYTADATQYGRYIKLIAGGSK